MTPPESPAAPPVRVMLVDDHELIRHGLARAFEREPSTEVVAQAGSVVQALSAWEQHTPDVVVDRPPAPRRHRLRHHPGHPPAERDRSAW